MSFSETQLNLFSQQGFIIERAFLPANDCDQLRQIVDQSLTPILAPVELEADVKYPGAPNDRTTTGGETPRRLLCAYTRDPLFRQFSSSEAVLRRVGQLLNSSKLALSQNHHNCIMTKHPGYSSDTLWHQDYRYWHFNHAQMVSVWLALGDEHPENGGMTLIPGSHNMTLSAEQFDEFSFFRTDLEPNQSLINQAVNAELKQGDVLFFHCNLLHAALRNKTDQIKCSLVFTYRDQDNTPTAGTRSALYPDIPFALS